MVCTYERFLDLPCLCRRYNINIMYFFLDAHFTTHKYFFGRPPCIRTGVYGGKTLDGKYFEGLIFIVINLIHL